MSSVYIIGYYDHGNFGDEQYKLTINSLISDINIKFNLFNQVSFLDCDSIKNKTFQKNDIIILGGGDILNEYFLDTVINKFYKKENKIIALSVGLPYTSTLIYTNKLNIIDYIFIRAKKDLNLFKKYFDESRVFYIPDLSIKLKSICQFKKSDCHNQINFEKLKGKKIICFCLSRHIYRNNSENYKKIVTNISKFINYLAGFNYYIVLLPFNRNSKSNTENDMLINNDICELINEKSCTLNITEDLDVEQTFSLFNLFDIVIPMRFHACLFSIYNNIPFFPIFTTRKIKNLLLETEWNHGYELNTESKGVPLDLDLDILQNRFYALSNNLEYAKKKINNINYNMERQFNEILSKQFSLFKNYTSFEKRDLANQDKYKNSIEKFYNKIINLYNSKEFLNDLDDFERKNVIVGLTSYFLTEYTDSLYNWGLMEKMFNKNFNYYDEFKWVIMDNSKQKLIDNKSGIFNLTFINQTDYAKVHRSGWQFVFDRLKYLNNTDSDLLLDLYVDKTFHWNYNVNKLINLIPYNKPWIGFIHHTFDTTFSEYNTFNLCNNKDFLKSLKYCKALFVLSNYLLGQLKVVLKEYNVPIFALIHPTELYVKQFSYKSFIDNPDKKLLHIGGWLRNIYAFYNLEISTIKLKSNKSIFGTSKIYKLSKTAIKGEGMNNYFPNISGTRSNCSPCKNNWDKEFCKYTDKMLNSVKIIERLEDSDYDEILTNNIVFLCLIDASAVNTLIECIVRNTPIIINKHPAVVELLGQGYPLYYEYDYDYNNDYNNIDIQVNNLLSNSDSIKSATKYLSKIDKNLFNIDYFVEKFSKIVSKI